MKSKNILSIHQLPSCEDDGELLVSYLKKDSEEVLLKRREVLILDDNHVYFVLDGQLAITIRRQHKIIDYAFLYMPIGLVEDFIPNIPIYYRAINTVNLLKVPISALDSIYNSSSPILTKALLTIEAGMLSGLLSTYNERCSGSGYQTIKSLIEHYCLEPQQLESISGYILNRTNLSRSYVFSTLSKLKDSGILIMEDGRITEVKGVLPRDLSELQT